METKNRVGRPRPKGIETQQITMKFPCDALRVVDRERKKQSRGFYIRGLLVRANKLKNKR